jgi:hypothetical protein
MPPGTAVVDVAGHGSGAPRLAPGLALRDFHCTGCGRRLLRYVAEAMGPRALITVRCRDCKTDSTLRGADVARLLHALSHGGDHA